MLGMATYSVFEARFSGQSSAEVIGTWPFMVSAELSKVMHDSNSIAMLLDSLLLISN